MRTLVVFVSLLFVGLVACNSDLGEECDEEGSAGPCADGLVCGKRSATSGDLVCLKQCSAVTDCTVDEDCIGVPGGALKGCRAKR